jgi:hypothetical protein
MAVFAKKKLSVKIYSKYENSDNSGTAITIMHSALNYDMQAKYRHVLLNR